ncbi:unnamed protein product [Pleuronectes platessa]|uniref:Uncharacterized protein n=1 Tax=Pleuronectes platessa TaxID=8262 RepID=A0A9N7UDS0_PLEPL|nr:unnamed protein product [Pleuronectes platessa]
MGEEVKRSRHQKREKVEREESSGKKEQLPTLADRSGDELARRHGQPEPGARLIRDTGVHTAIRTFHITVGLLLPFSPISSEENGSEVQRNGVKAKEGDRKPKREPEKETWLLHAQQGGKTETSCQGRRADTRQHMDEAVNGGGVAANFLPLNFLIRSYKHILFQKDSEKRRELHSTACITIHHSIQQQPWTKTYNDAEINLQCSNRNLRQTLAPSQAFIPGWLPGKPTIPRHVLVRLSSAMRKHLHPVFCFIIAAPYIRTDAATSSDGIHKKKVDDNSNTNLERVRQLELCREITATFSDETDDKKCLRSCIERKEEIPPETPTVQS